MDNMVAQMMQMIMMVMMFSILGVVIGQNGGVVPSGSVVVGIVNPPVDANFWQLSLFDTEWGESSLASEIPITSSITLDELPSGWSYPLLLDIMIYQHIESFDILYQVQSAYGPDFPFYRAIAIQEPGIYTYDVATGELSQQ